MSGTAGNAAISGVTPDSTTAQLAGQVPKEPRHGRNESAASDLPGSYPETPFHDAQEFSVNPIPASSGIGNPVSTKPGEKVPDHSEVPTRDTTTADSLDKDSYEKAGSAPSFPQQDTSAQGGMFGVLPIGRGVIPESSIPMGGDVPSEKDMSPMIQSAGAGTSTAALAAQVPKEPRGIPQVVTDSQDEAGVGPEAGGNQEAVEEKSAMEKELESKVPEEPASSGVGAGVIAGGSGKVPPSVQQSIDDYNKGVPIASGVPDAVQESISESKTTPEAAGSAAAVGNKAEVEQELLKDVKPTDAAGEPAPATSAALMDKAPAPTDDKPSVTDTDKSSVTGADHPATTPAQQGAMAEAIKQQQPDSRDVSPMSHPPGQQPSVTTGAASSGTGTTSAPKESPSASTPASKSSAGASTDKKSKRSSGFFGKLKEKMHRDK